MITGTQSFEVANAGDETPRAISIEQSASLDFVPGRRRGKFKLGKSTGDGDSPENDKTNKRNNTRRLVKRRTADAFNFFRRQEKEAKKQQPESKRKKKKRKFFGFDLKRISAPVVKAHANPAVLENADSTPSPIPTPLHFPEKKAQSLQVQPTRGPSTSRSKLEAALDAKRSNSAVSPRKSPKEKSKLEKAIDDRKKADPAEDTPKANSKLNNALSRDDTAFDFPVRVFRESQKPQFLKKSSMKKPGSISKKKHMLFAPDTIFENSKKEAHSEIKGRTRIMSISRKTINRQQRHISIVNRGSVVKRAQNARRFFEKGAVDVPARSPGLSVVDRPNLARTRIISVIGRASVANRAESARKKFTKQSKENKHHYKPKDCPGCGMTVYFRERYQASTGDFWHRGCWEVEQKIAQPGSEVSTPYGKGVIISLDENIAIVNLGWGKGYLQKSCVRPTNETIDAFVAETPENIDFKAGKEMFKIMEKENALKLNSECPGCGEKVLAAEDHAKLGGHLWHRGCFQCQICSVPLKHTYKAHEKMPMCYRCYEEEVLCDYFCAVLNPGDYQCEIPNNYLSNLEITDSIWSLFTSMNKNRVKFFTIVIDSETSLIPEKMFLSKQKELVVFDEETLESIPKKKQVRSNLLRAKEYGQFWDVLVSEDIPKVGVIHLVFKLNAHEDISRICEKVVCCVFIPEKAPVKQKLLYGAMSGIIHNDVPAVSKVIAGSFPDDFLFANVLTACRKDFKY